MFDRGRWNSAIKPESRKHESHESAKEGNTKTRKHESKGERVRAL
jgi:hypothetical protein